MVPYIALGFYLALLALAYILVQLNEEEPVRSVI